MAAYLFTWNPLRWPWTNIEDEMEKYRKHGFLNSRWSCGVTRRIVPGDRVFLIKLGSKSPRGIMASGYSLSSPFEAENYSDEKKTGWYVNLRFDVLLMPKNQGLLELSLLKREITRMHWTPQASGISIHSESVSILERLWSEHLKSLGMEPLILAEQVESPELHWEGAIRSITVNAYERDPRARKACVQYYGWMCGICGFDFAVIFGELGKEFIHVHHLRPLSEIREGYEVDPVTDLLPVCPNCHSMLHRKNPTLAPDELRKVIELNRRSL